MTDPVQAPEIPTASTRDRILRESSILFARKGYGATSTREIAQAVGIQQPSLFHHFDSKAEIMQELLMHSLALPTSAAERLASESRPAAERLYEYLLFDSTHILKSPFDLGGLDTDDIVNRAEFSAWAAVRNRLRAARRQMIAQGIESKEFVNIGVDFAAHALTGIMLGITRTYSGRGGEDADKLAGQLASFALKALLADPKTLEPLRQRVFARLAPSLSRRTR